MWVLIVITIGAGTMVSVPGYSSADSCTKAGAQAIKDFQNIVPGARIGFMCLKPN
jgi:hypothetical protein